MLRAPMASEASCIAAITAPGMVRWASGRPRLSLRKSPFACCQSLPALQALFVQL